MKVLFYKFSKTFGISFGIRILILPLFLCLPFMLKKTEMINIDVFTSFFFIFAGTIYINEINESEKSGFKKYFQYLMIKKSYYVSYMFILTVASNAVMYIYLLILNGVFRIFEENVLFTAATPFFGLSSMFSGLAIVGFAMLIYFRFSYTPSILFYILTYCFMSFGAGFIYGYYEGRDISGNIFYSAPFRLVTAAVSVVLFVLEWWLSTRAYEKKEL